MNAALKCPKFDACRQHTSHTLVAVALLLLPLTGLAAGTPAGTTVTNQATLIYEVTGSTQQVLSNNNAVTVQELINVAAIWQDASNVSTTSPALEQPLTYLVRNTGNGVETFAFTINNSPPGSDDFDPFSARIHIDGNSNNSYDGPALDPVYTPGSNDPILDANSNDSVVLFVLNDIPPAFSTGETGDSRLTVQSRTSGAAGAAAGSVLAGLGDSGADAVVGSSNANATATGIYQVNNGSVDVSITKSGDVIADGLVCKSTPCEPVPGASIRYTLIIGVTGTGVAENLAITDSIPANTSYTPASITLDSVPQTDGSGDDAGSFSTNLVSVDLGDITGPASFIITLDVTVN